MATVKDNDAAMLRAMGGAITDLQVQYRAATLEDQALLGSKLRELLSDYGEYQARLLKDGTITTDEELAEMREIARSISDAADRQGMLIAIAKLIALIAAA